MAPILNSCCTATVSDFMIVLTHLVALVRVVLFTLAPRQPPQREAGELLCLSRKVRLVKCLLHQTHVTSLPWFECCVAAPGGYPYLMPPESVAAKAQSVNMARGANRGIAPSAVEQDNQELPVRSNANRRSG